MAEVEPSRDARAGLCCQRCGKRLGQGEAFEHMSRCLCEECYIDARMPKKRKTHWQYLGKIRADYLRYPDDD